MKLTHTAASMAFGLLASTTVSALPIVAGFNTNTLASNDDGSTGLVDLGFSANFFGVSSTQAYVNNNGNITFDNSLSSFTPFDLTSTGQQIIAPFFADVDTRAAGDPVTYGQGTYDGRDAFGVNWINVDYFNGSTSHTNRNSFQLILADRSDISAGDFDIIFNYDQIQWETGEASDGDANGLGGDSSSSRLLQWHRQPRYLFRTVRLRYKRRLPGRRSQCAGLQQPQFWC